MLGQELKAKWLAALRSGAYPQTGGMLRNEIGYCCLGVLASLVGKELPLTHTSQAAVLGQSAALRHCGAAWLDSIGLADLLGPVSPSLIVPSGTKVLISGPASVQSRLAAMNDSGTTFAAIADWIEENIEPNVAAKLIGTIEEKEEVNATV